MVGAWVGLGVPSILHAAGKWRIPAADESSEAVVGSATAGYVSSTVKVSSPNRSVSRSVCVPKSSGIVQGSGGVRFSRRPFWKSGSRQQTP